MEEKPMLTAKENFREVVRGGNPDRISNQYEALQLLVHPFLMFTPGMLQKGQPDTVDAFSYFTFHNFEDRILITSPLAR